MYHMGGPVVASWPCNTPWVCVNNLIVLVYYTQTNWRVNKSHSLQKFKFVDSCCCLTASRLA